MDVVHWIWMAWNEVSPYTIQRCFYEEDFYVSNKQSSIEAAKNLGSILLELHTEIELVTYLEADWSLLICNNNIVEEKEDNSEEKEMEEIDKTWIMITFK